MQLFKDAPATENFAYRKTCGEIEVGLYPVMYGGWRIRAGVIGQGYCEVDYCAGSKSEDVKQLFSIIIGIITRLKTNQDRLNEKLKKENIQIRILLRTEDIVGVLRALPKQKVKPMFNDPECLLELIKLTGGEVTLLEIPELWTLKNDYRNQWQ